MDSLILVSNHYKEPPPEQFSFRVGRVHYSKQRPWSASPSGISLNLYFVKGEKLLGYMTISFKIFD